MRQDTSQKYEEGTSLGLYDDDNINDEIHTSRLIVMQLSFDEMILSLHGHCDSLCSNIDLQVLTQHNYI